MFDTAFLKVSCVDAAFNFKHFHEVDYYVPFSFRTYENVLGSDSIRLGDYAQSLMSLSVPSESGIIRGVTITSIKSHSAWPEISIASSHKKMVRIENDQFHGEPSEDLRIFDIKEDFKTSIEKKGSILAWWGSLKGVDSYESGGGSFLVNDGLLVGFQFDGISDVDMDILEKHHPKNQQHEPDRKRIKTTD